MAGDMTSDSSKDKKKGVNAGGYPDIGSDGVFPLDPAMRLADLPETARPYCCDLEVSLTIGDVRLFSERHWAMLCEENEKAEMLRSLVFEGLSAKQFALYRRNRLRALFGPSDISVVDAKLIKVQIGDKAYKVERFCPHKNYDLANASVKNGVLVCPKHGYAFDVANGGGSVGRPECKALWCAEW